MIGFEWTAAKFFWYMFFMYFTLLYFTFYGMMAVGLTPNHNIASIVSSAFYAIWNLFSGFIIPRPVSSDWSEISILVRSFIKVYPLKLLLHFTENSYLVEMVLLDMPCFMDPVRFGCFPIWRHTGRTWHRCGRGWFCQELLWVSTRLLGSGSRGCCRIPCALCFPIRILNKNAQLPKKMMKVSYDWLCKKDSD